MLRLLIAIVSRDNNANVHRILQIICNPIILLLLQVMLQSISEKKERRGSSEKNSLTQKKSRLDQLHTIQLEERPF